MSRVVPCFKKNYFLLQRRNYVTKNNHYSLPLKTLYQSKPKIKNIVSPIDFPWWPLDPFPTEYHPIIGNCFCHYCRHRRNFPKPLNNKYPMYTE